MLRKSPLFDFFNRRDGTNFDRLLADGVEDEDYINWNGFLLPVDYGDAAAEYHSIRNECAICDISPMRKIRVRGDSAGQFFDHLVTRPISKLPAMRATYTVLCNEDGSLKDDAIVYKIDNDDYLILPSDVDHSPYFESVCERFEIGDVTFDDCTDGLLGIAIQGPRSAAAMHEMGFDEMEQLKPFEVRDYEAGSGSLRVARMGFTGDLGYECWFEPALADEVMRRITHARAALNIAIPGYGLTALQVCRIEGGFIVAGWDCATEIEPQPGFERSPYELGLGWLVNLDAAEFVGRDALIDQEMNGRRYALRYFTIDDTVQIEDGTEIFASSEGGDDPIGIVTCAIWSWGLNETIGNVSIRSKHADLRQAWIAIDKQRVALTLSTIPLIALERRNEVPASLV